MDFHRPHTIEVEPKREILCSAVILPANAMCAEIYVGVANELAVHGIRTCIMTLPGFNGVPPLPNISWGKLVDDILPTIEKKLGSGGALIGHSLGGLLALLVASRLPMKKLILIEPAIAPTRRMASICAAVYERRTINCMRAGVFRNRGSGFRRIHDVKSYPAQILALALKSARTTDCKTVEKLVRGSVALYPLPFASVTAKTLLVRGSSSGVSQRINSWMLRRKIPSAKQVTIRKAGHWIVGEQDKNLAEAIASFV